MQRRHFLQSAGAAALLPGFAFAQDKYPSKPITFICPYAPGGNADLRSRKIKESILDDFPGLGPKRRDLLLAHFGSIDRLRAATAAQIAGVDGIGPKSAADLHAFLRPASPSHEEPDSAD